MFDAWKTHKQVCLGKLLNGENKNMEKHYSSGVHNDFGIK
jgi:hypothetical protein